VDNYIVDLAQEEKSEKPLDCHREGVARYNQAEQKVKKYRFPDNRVSCLFIDQYRNIWVGTQKGVLRYHQGKIVLQDGKKVEKGDGWTHFHE